MDKRVTFTKEEADLILDSLSKALKEIAAIRLAIEEKDRLITKLAQEIHDENLEFGYLMTSLFHIRAIQPSSSAPAETGDFKKSYLQEYRKVIAFDDLFKKLHAEIKEKLESYKYWGENPRIEFPPES